MPAHLSPAVVVDGLSKTFSIPQEKAHTLKERALHPFRTVRTESFDALTDVSLAVNEGEFFGIVGRNGSGKSTLLKCLAGIYRANRGDIYVRGRMSTFLELGVGFNPDLAAWDNVIINAIMLGLTPREARERFDRVIEFAELEEFVDLKVKNYSSGMLVRLAFSTMIQADADILLIDEVLAVGDISFQQKCFDVFKRMRDEGRTVLFVTHDMASVNRFCHRAALLERGRLVAIDEPKRISERYVELNLAQDRGRPVEDPGSMLAIASAPSPPSGDGSATLEDGWLENEQGVRTGAFPQGDRCVLRAALTFNRAVENPLFNIVFVNEHSQNVFAVSNAVSGEGRARFDAGESAEVTLSFENALAPGRYEVSMLVAHSGGGHRIMDRRERLTTMLVGGAGAAGGLVDLPHDLRVERVAPRSLEQRPI